MAAFTIDRVEPTATDTFSSGSFIDSDLVIAVDSAKTYIGIAQLLTDLTVTANVHLRCRHSVEGVGTFDAPLYQIGVTPRHSWHNTVTWSGGTEDKIQLKVSQSSARLFGVTADDISSNLTVMGFNGFGVLPITHQIDDVTGSDESITATVFTATSLTVTVPTRVGGKWLATANLFVSNGSTTFPSIRMDIGGTTDQAGAQARSVAGNTVFMYNTTNHGDLNGDVLIYEAKVNAGTMNLKIGSFIQTMEIGP